MAHGPRGYIEGSCTHGRSNQLLPDGLWRLWLVKAGRGWGKTRVGAEAVREWSETNRRVNIIGATMDDARDIMVEGESGILSVFPNERRARYIHNRRLIEYPSGAIGQVFSADEPERLRGPQHYKLWLDEIAAWRYLDMAFDMAMLGLRLGANPQAVLTSTPKAIPLVRSLRDRTRIPPGDDPLGTVIMSEGSTFENEANLAPPFLAELVQKYTGTRMGRQELDAEVLEDIEGALWTSGMIEPYRRRATEIPELVRIVVAVDPATTHGEDSDYTAIVVAGIDAEREYYVLQSEQLHLTPNGWGSRVFALADKWDADAIVGEVNQGGEMVENTLRNIRRDGWRWVPVHAKKGKSLRAEPVVGLYEQGRVHHVGMHAAMEDQQTSFPVGNEHDDLVDANVYALTELTSGSGGFAEYYRHERERMAEDKRKGMAA